MAGPIGTTATPVDGGIISSSQFGVPTAIANQNYAENQWVDFSSTFQFTASTTNPTKGTSIWSARYLWIHPRLIRVVYHLKPQSGYAIGSGFWLFGVPIQAADSAGLGAVGGFDMFRQGVNHQTGLITFNNSLFLQAQRNGDSSPVGATTMGSSLGTGAWGNPGDFIRMSIEYEPL